MTGWRRVAVTMTDFIIPLARRDGHRRRPRRAEGGEPRGARARRPADAGRLLPHARTPIGADRRARARRRWSRSFAAADLRAAAPAVGRDQARPLRAADRAGDSRAAARGLARAARRERRARRGALLGADRGPRRAPISPASSRASSASTTRPNSSPPCAPAGRRCGPPMRAATWSNHGLSPADTAMAVLIQPLVAARASGGGLSETAEGQMLHQRHLGARLGDRAGRGGARPHRAQPPGLPAQDRGRPQGSPRDLRPRRRRRAAGGAERARARAVPRRRPGGDARPPAAQGGRRASAMPVEIEWALDDAGFKLLQARPLHVQPAHRAGRDLAASIPASTAIRPASAGAPAAPWWSTASASLSRVAPGDVLVTRSPARRSATSCRASPAWWPSSAARPRISPRSRASAASRWCSACSTPPRRIPDGAQVAVDGVAGIVRWLADAERRARASSSPSRSPRARSSACARSRASRSIRTTAASSPSATLIAAVQQVRHPVLPAARPDRPRRDRRQSEAAPHRGAIDLAVQHRRRRGDRARIPVTVVPPVTTEATADLTFGLMLAVARRMVEGDRLVRAGKFPGGAVAPSARLVRLGQDRSG